MIERSRVDRSIIANRCRSFNISTGILFTLLLYCFIFIKRINGDAVLSVENFNVSSNEQEAEVNVEYSADVNISVIDALPRQNTTNVNDVMDIPTTTTNTTEKELEPQQSKLHATVDNDTFTISYDYLTQQDDDYTYDDDVTFVVEENDISVSLSQSAPFVQDPEQRFPHNDGLKSIEEDILGDDFVDTQTNETITLSKVPASEEAKLEGDNVTNETNNIYAEDAKSEINLLGTSLEHTFVLDEKQPIIETSSTLDLPLLGNDTSKVQEVHVNEELEDALANNGDNNVMSSIVQKENIASEDPMNGTISRDSSVLDSTKSQKESIASGDPMNGTISRDGFVHGSTKSCSHQQNQTQHYYCSTVWGNRKVTRRRPSTNLSILEQLFMEDLDDTNPNQLNATARPYNFTNREPRYGKRNGSNNNSVFNESGSFDTLLPKKHSHLPQQTNLMNNELDGHHTEILPKVNENQLVLDDVDDLFQKADETDEFDVSTKDSSIQEVLMGSATRIIIKRCTIAGRFIYSKVRVVKDYLYRHMRKIAENNKTLQNLSDMINDLKKLKWLPNSEYGDSAFLRWMQHENDEFAPLRRFRNSNGDWIVLENLKDSNGKLLGSSIQHIQTGFEWIQINALTAFKHVDELLDTILSGSKARVDDEQLEFKFLADKDFIKQRSFEDK